MPDDAFAPARYLGDHELLTAAMATAGVEVRTPRPRQVTYRPGRALTIAYDAQVRSGAARWCTDRIVVHVARRPLEGCAPVAVDGDGHPVHVFPARLDPALPGLRRALDPALLAGLFDDLGLERTDEPVTTALRSHRPLRRAVVEASSGRRRLFLKVVPPPAAEALHDRHRALVAAGLPVPPSAGWAPDGIVALGAIAGRTLRGAVLARLPSPELGAIERVLDRLPAELLGWAPAVPSHERLATHVGLLGAVLPEQAGRTAELAAAIGAAIAASDPGPAVPVHGDLYDGQLVVDGGRVLGLLDVDGAGRGHRVDDLANLLGHLSVLGIAQRSTRAESIGARWMRDVDRRRDVDPAGLRSRVAAVVLGVATGCFRVQEPSWPTRTTARIDLAEAWLASARRALAVG